MSQAVADKASSYVTALRALKDDDRLRSLKPRAGIDFPSNDYLALASASADEKGFIGRGRRRHPDRGRLCYQHRLHQRMLLRNWMKRLASRRALQRHEPCASQGEWPADCLWASWP